MENKNIPYEKLGIIGFIVAGTLGVFLGVLSILRYTNIYFSSRLTESYNLIVLFVFGIIIRAKTLNFKDDRQIQVFADSLNIAGKDLKTAKFDIDRVNKVIAQLCDKVYWFIIFLLVFYVLNLLEDFYPEYFRTHFQYPFPILGFFKNVLNIVSASFIYFGFKILHDRTLDERNNPKSYYKGTIIFLLGFIISYLFLLLSHVGDPDRQDKISNYYNLACGLYNGWAMGLLFGRLISMEYFFKDIQLTTHKFSKQFFHYGAIYILPMYVLANCMYGVQELAIFSIQNMQALKALIFLACFVGKGFFLLFIYHYVNLRWLHIYLHLVLANNRIPRNIMMLINNRKID